VVITAPTTRSFIMTTDTILHVDAENFDQEVLKSDVPVLVDFMADWCQPCHALAPTIDQIAETYAGRLKVAKIDIDVSKLLAQEYGINSIPTVTIFKGGQVAARFVGVQTQQDYAAAIDSLLD
jgi:thioredoxin 1